MFVSPAKALPTSAANKPRKLFADEMAGEQAGKERAGLARLDAVDMFNHVLF